MEIVKLASDDFILDLVKGAYIELLSAPFRLYVHARNSSLAVEGISLTLKLKAYLLKVLMCPVLLNLGSLFLHLFKPYDLKP